MITPLILAGGSGSRLWPLSRAQFPKQFIALIDSKLTLFQQTVLRVVNMPISGNPVIICNHDTRFMVAEQLRQIGVTAAAIILEPIGRNTAPAVALGAFFVSENQAGNNLLVLPSDHSIQDHNAFQAAVTASDSLASSGKLITYGITASSPETGYGYIKRGADAGNGAFEVEKFVEKPDAITAQSYLDTGEFYWNSGMFAFSPEAYLSELKQHAKDIHSAAEVAYRSQEKDLDFIRIKADDFERCRSESIDYAVMESTDKATVLPLDAAWNDVGVWSSIWDVSDKTADNNCISGDVIHHDVKNSLIRAEHKLVTAIGVENLIIVETDDAVLVADKSKSQDVKKIVEELKAKKREEINAHTRVYRPWGWYESACADGRYQVKRICVEPGSSLSLQMHYHRAEHWIVVKGTANITRGEEVIQLIEDQSTYIPLGTTHRLENPGVIPLEIIEVQTGSYLGEDDIVRFEDMYGR